MNAYAIYSAPRTSGNEAIVLCASWKSLKWDEDGSLNLRGVATILALAGYLNRTNFFDFLGIVIYRVGRVYTMGEGYYIRD